MANTAHLTAPVSTSRRWQRLAAGASVAALAAFGLPTHAVASTSPGAVDDARPSAPSQAFHLPAELPLLVIGGRGTVDLLRGAGVEPGSARVVSVTDGRHGTAACDDDGSCYYQPGATFRGSDSFLAHVQLGEEVQSVLVRAAGQPEPEAATAEAAPESLKIGASSLKTTSMAVETASTTGSISGTVTVPVGAASAVCVNAFSDISGGFAQVVDGAPTSSGTYTISGLEPSSYTVLFQPCSSGTSLADEYWENTQDWMSATPVDVVAGADSAGINATMELSGTISGTVTVPSGSAADVCVSANNQASGGGATVVAGSPVTTGTYTIEGLPPGDYTVFFSRCWDSSAELIGEYWENTTNWSAATPVRVTGGKDTQGIDATMALGGSISGSVTVPSGSAGDVCVSAYNNAGGTGAAVTPGTPATTGTYRLTGLAAGSYTVMFRPCSESTNLITEYWNDTTDFRQATPVTVAEGADTAGISATMAAGGFISGTVTVPSGSAADVCVSAYNNGAHAFARVAAGTPTTSGTYTVSGLLPGSYTVRFAPCSSGVDLVAEYWEDTTKADEATPVQVAGGATTSGINAALVTGGKLQGTVTVPSGSAGAICVSASSADYSGGAGFAQVTAGSPTTTGTYTIAGLATDSYVVQFRDCSAAGEMATEYWKDVTDRRKATAVAVVAGSTASGIDAAMAVGGRITGAVTVPAGSAGAVCVTASSRTAHAFGQVIAGTPTTTGSYTVKGLPTGSYAVHFRPCDGTTNLVDESWENSVQSVHARPVSVTAGSTVSGIDTAMAIGGTITGTVTVPAGATATDVCVGAYNDASNGFTFVGPGSSSTTGSYTITGLAPGQYLVMFMTCQSGSSLVREYWQDAQDPATATRIGVTAGGTASGIDASMAQGGRISGTVTVPSGSAGDVCVAAYGDAGNTFTWVEPGSPSTTGTYLTGGVPAGSYTVMFMSCNGSQFRTEYWNNASSPEAATPVTVSGTATTTGIDAELAESAAVAPSAPTGVTVTAAAGKLTVSWAAADGNGSPITSYRVTPSPAGRSVVVSGTTTSAVLTGLYNGSVYDVTVTADSDGGSAESGEASGTPNGCVGTRFSDVAAGAQFCAPIGWMASRGISTGSVLADGTVEYRPTTAVSRQAMAPFLYRAAGEPAFTPPTTPSFADVPTSHSFYKEIEWMFAKGISKGTAQPEGKPLYKPADPVSRQAMAPFLYRALGSLAFTAPAEPTFADVPANHQFYMQIEWMYAERISTGSPQPDGKPLYKPVDPVSRQAMAAFLNRAYT